MKEVYTNIDKYYHLFNDYEAFHNFIQYAIQDLKPQIFVDNEETPQCVVFYSSPAYFILGEPNIEYTNDVLSLFPSGSWIIASSNNWKSVLNDYYLDRVMTHKRTLFSSDFLNINEIIKHRSPLPEGFSIEPIEQRHLIQGMIYDDVLSRFFTKSDFLSHGFGFALVDALGQCHGFSLTNYPIIGNDVELYFRVGYDSYPDFRQKGIGTTLCTYFIEEAFKRGYNPVWDSANETSAHIAKKLGYIEKKEWFMYHVL